jgi:hypothetical protein
MKHIKQNLIFAALAALAALAASCSLPFNPPSSTAAAGAGTVVLTVSSEEAGSARTILPGGNQVFSRYELVFSKVGAEDVKPDTSGITGSGVRQELAVGTWTVTVSAYNSFRITDTGNSGNSDNSSIIGTYTGMSDGYPATLTVDSGTWTLYIPDLDRKMTGTYKLSGATATLFLDNGEFGTAVLSGNTLTGKINTSSGDPETYTFTKSGNIIGDPGNGGNSDTNGNTSNGGNPGNSDTNGNPSGGNSDNNNGSNLPNQQEYLAAQGSAQVTVSAGQVATVTVILEPVTTGEKGIFTYTVTFPYVAKATGTLGDYSVDLISGEKVSVEVEPGYYDLTITFRDNAGTLIAGASEKVHIYSGLESVAEYTFDEDFSLSKYPGNTGDNGNGGNTDPEKPGEEPGTDPGRPSEEPNTDPEKPGEEPGTDPEKPGEEPGTDPERPGEEPNTDPEQPPVTPTYYTVTFMVEGAQTTQEVAEGTSITVPANPTKAGGYRFFGWNHGNGYAQGSDSYTVNNDVTFQAEFIKQWTVTYYRNGSPVQITVDDGYNFITDLLNNIPNSLTPPVSGWTFNNWDYAGMEPSGANFSSVDGDITINPVWRTAEGVLVTDGPDFEQQKTTPDGSGNNNGNSGGTIAPKTLEITDVDAALVAQGQIATIISIFPAGTTTTEALSGVGVVAVTDSSTPASTIKFSGSGPYTTITADLDIPGSGPYDIYLELMTIDPMTGLSAQYYRQQNVPFTADTVLLSLWNFSPVSPEALIGGFNITGYDGGKAMVYAVTSDPATGLAALAAMTASPYIGAILPEINVNTVNWTNAPPAGTYTILVNYDYDGDTQSDGLVKITGVYIDSDGSGSADWNNRIVLASVN